MFFIEIVITPDGEQDYKINIETNLPSPDLVKKVLDDASGMWDTRIEEGFKKEPDLWDRTDKSTVPDGYNDYY